MAGAPGLRAEPGALQMSTGASKTLLLVSGIPQIYLISVLIDPPAQIRRSPTEEF